MSMRNLVCKAIFSIFLSGLLAVNANAANWDGKYTSSFSYEMTRASLCPKPLSINITFTVKNLMLNGTIKNLGSDNKNAFCNVYHSGSVSGSVDSSGNIVKVDVVQNDVHSAQYSSYSITGNLAGELTLLSRSKKFHPPKLFRLTKEVLLQPKIANGSGLDVFKCFSNPSDCEENNEPADLTVPSLQEQPISSTNRPQLSPAMPIARDPIKAKFMEFELQSRKFIQSGLANLDFYRSSIDGLYGPGTRKALESYFDSRNIISTDDSLIRLTLEDLIDEGENLFELDRAVYRVISVDEELIDQHAYERYLLEDVGGFVSLNPGGLDPVELATLYIPAKSEIEKQGYAGKNYEKLKALVTGNQEFMDYHSEQIDKRQAAVDAEIDSEFEFINNAVDKLRVEVASDPLSEKSMRLTAIIGQYSGIDRKRDAGSIIELADGLRTQLQKADVQFDVKESELKPVAVLNENAPLVELSSLEPNDAALIVHFGPKAPHTYKDLDGTFAFSDYSANVCAPALAGSDKRYAEYLREKLKEIFPKPYLNLSTSCSSSLEGLDLIFVTGADVSNGLNLPPVLELGAAFKVGAITNYKVIKFADFQNKQQELNLLSDRLFLEVAEGTRLGLGAVYNPTQPQSLCIVEISEQEPGYDEVLSEVGNVSKLFLGKNLSEAKYTDLRSAFRGLQKGDCGTVFGSTTSLANLINAANKSAMELKALPVWFSERIIQDRRAELEARKHAEVQRQQKSKEQLAFELEQRRQKELALAQQLETKEADSRAQYGLRVKGLVADIDKQIERMRSEIDGAFSTNRGLDSAVKANSFWNNLPNWYSDNLLKGWEFDRMVSEPDDYGTVQWNGRELEGIVSKLVVYMRNADLGQYSETCWLVGYKVDTEFDRLRDPLVVNCDATASNVLWKTKSSFISRWNFVE